jgi:hypothetical protein
VKKRANFCWLSFLIRVSPSFAARTRQKKIKSFFVAACTWQKILCGFQTCERSERAAAGCSLLKKMPAFF